MAEPVFEIYQSGEKVPFNGTFKVVGISLADAEQSYERGIRQLKAGEVFATYEGMEVCWHLVVVQQPMPGH